MKVTIDWLKEYVDFDLSPEELVNKLAMLGLEVDTVDYQSWDFNGLVVGKVTRKEHHQHSAHLWICEVDIGTRKLSIVCGAPNVDVGQKVPVAVDGTSLPSGKTIKATTIKGIESQGMICSEAELGVSSRGEGIMVLDERAKVGSRLQDVLGQGEVVLDIDVTPNRPDCLGVIGIAREIAAATGAQLKRPTLNLQEDGTPISEHIQIEVLAPEACPRYTARFIGGVTVGPSPWWLVKRLEAVGIRSINNVVDVTNFVMMETGQPLHAFDYDLLHDRKIIVKHADEGEPFTTLDDKTHVLSSNVLMICDGQRPVAIGGVMGGQNSEVSNTTKNVLLECAYFDPMSIRKTAKHLGIATESSRRFERGTDPNEGLLFALHRAAQLMAELSGGQVARDYIDVYSRRIHPVKIKLRPQRVSQVLGAEIPANRIKSILTRLELAVTGRDVLEVEVPTFRPDLTREVDLIEEIARVHGYDNIPPDTRAFFEQLEPKPLLEIFSRNVRHTLVSFGFSEVVTYSMISRKIAELMIETDRIVPLRNPLSEDLSNLRPSLIPGLLGVIQWNLNRKIKNLKIFELGDVFFKSRADDAEVIEETRLAGAVTGLSREESWSEKAHAVDFYDLKGYVEYLLRRNFVTDWGFKAVSTPITNERTLGLVARQEVIGYLGEVRKEILEAFDIEQPVYTFEIDFSRLRDSVSWQRIYESVPKFPAVERDIAVVVDKRIKAEDIAREIEKHGGSYLQGIKLFDVYTGEQVGREFKSLAFNLTFYSLERTLKEEEVEVQIQRILSALSEKFSARLRD